MLIYLFSAGERDVIRKFLGSNAKVNHPDGDGNTPLHVAANHGKYKHLASPVSTVR